MSYTPGTLHHNMNTMSQLVPFYIFIIIHLIKLIPPPHMEKIDLVLPPVLVMIVLASHLPHM
jgi:hypothetical protein